MSGKRLTLRYYAQLREQCGQAQEEVVTEAATPADLYVEVSKRHGFTLPQASLKVAVRDHFTAWQVPLQDGDVVQFVPPVAGG